MISMTKEIVAVISAVSGIVTTGIPLLLGLIRKAKLLIKERNWTMIIAMLPNFITQAEQFINYTGVEKKEFVKSRLAVYSIHNKIAFDEKKFDASIDEIVKLTKEVNKRDKDKIQATLENKAAFPLTLNN